MSFPTASNCSDIRDINEAKVANILSYLDSSSHQPPHYYGISGVEGSLSQELEETGRHATPHVLSFNNQHNHNNSNASLPLSAVHMPQPSLLASAPSSSGALPSLLYSQ
ncbi:hypothetical protein ADEAN_000437300 [Angomonas deanei]|uniref:Uncharacterized protein n=1 Tax=Angomonas deanei TaxID=59799 RepID=A0A7G2CBQ9_9TRYP|nr:hypothetical protein ADEAN_000437300 [Angomonas deanei]